VFLVLVDDIFLKFYLKIQNLIQDKNHSILGIYFLITFCHEETRGIIYLILEK
jgi:hypothetical protein